MHRRNCHDKIAHLSKPSVGRTYRPHAAHCSLQIPTEQVVYAGSVSNKHVSHIKNIESRSVAMIIAHCSSIVRTLKVTKRTSHFTISETFGHWTDPDLQVDSGLDCTRVCQESSRDAYRTYAHVDNTYLLQRRPLTPGF